MNGFLGATDSAVPCAMLLKISETFNKSFRASSDNSGDTATANDLGLMFIFFDGEEAFETWTATDSLYGSRHLAARWAEDKAPDECGKGKKKIETIELFVLLDLIGASDTSFVIYDQKLRHHNEALQKYERDYLSSAGFGGMPIRSQLAFKSWSLSMRMVQDDHVPFRQRGVPILLLLSSPFPRVWHTLNDNYRAIDFPKTRRILHCLEKFVENYQNTR